jgi:uncharacterized coiled-coil DUF342 family protein
MIQVNVMTKKEDLLRSEIDTLNAEMITLQAEIANLRVELDSLKIEIDDRMQNTLCHVKNRTVTVRLYQQKVSHSSKARFTSS